MLILSAVILVAFLMIIYEKRRPGRTWPEVRYWWSRAAFLCLVQIGIVYLAGLSWDRWMEEWNYGALANLTNFWGGIVGYLVITFVVYWWHRWRHSSDFLWKWIHQMHHSAERLEIVTTFYKHPFEILTDTLLFSVILYVVLGLTPEAAANALLLAGLGDLFLHWNIKTPHWLGYIFQRPESHCIHHQDGVHAYNYADLPLWDILFGTFKNPRSWESQCGLGQEGHRFKEMLMGCDVTKNPSKK